VNDGPTEVGVAEISDSYMHEMLTRSRAYIAVILKEGPGYRQPGVEKLIWEHGRRNFSLRADKLLSIVCPVADGSDIHGVGIFDAEADEVKRIMDGDPAVRAGVFTYELHPCRSFPGDALGAGS
jgi:hypothetical protein